MIKRYILHIEAHKWRVPRISFKRAPKHGDRVMDGGVMGTLKLCPECQEGFLHEPDPPRVRRSRPRPPRPTMLERVLADLSRNLTEQALRPARPVRSYHTPRPAMDFNPPTHVEIKDTTPELEPPTVELTVVDSSEHVEIKDAAEVEHVELKTEEHVEIKSEDESPEELELDYKLGNRKYVPSDRVWTHKAWYIVEKLEKDVLHLVREDVWEERQKKSEHVELKDKEEDSGEVVVLNFD